MNELEAEKKQEESRLAKCVVVTVSVAGSVWLGLCGWVYLTVPVPGSALFMQANCCLQLLPASGLPERTVPPAHLCTMCVVRHACIIERTVQTAIYQTQLLLQGLCTPSGAKETPSASKN